MWRILCDNSTPLAVQGALARLWVPGECEYPDDWPRTPGAVRVEGEAREDILDALREMGLDVRALSPLTGS